MKKSILAVAGVAAFVGVAMPVAGANATLTTEQTDTISVTIENNCQLSYGSTPHAGGSGDYKGTWSSNTLSTTIANNAADSAIGTTSLAVVCNDTAGYDVALTAGDLTHTNKADKISLSTTTVSAGTSAWTVNNGTSNIANAGYVLSADAETATGAVTVTYGVGTSTTQPAGTYSGTAKYTLTHPQHTS